MSTLLNKLNNFGCPWHGLIEGGQLTLPTGELLAMPQPAGLTYEQGNTSLIALPSAPVATRTPEQQEADTLAGMQWFDKAMISGSQIHGKSIGAGCWIYNDAAGINWLVSTTLQGASGNTTSCTVTLERFGVFGGEAEQYAYTVPVPVPALAAEYAYWNLPAASARLHLYSAHPQGQAGMFALLGKWEWLEERRPIAWVELTLSGLASAATVALDLVKTAVQAAGAVVHNDQFRDIYDQYQTYSLMNLEVEESTYNSADCSGYIIRTVAAAPVEGYQAGSRLMWYRDTVGSFTIRNAFEGCILGLVYSPTGTKIEITLDADATVMIDAPAPNVTAQDYIFDVEYAPSGSECVGTRRVAQPLLYKISKTTSTVNTGRLVIKVAGAPVITRSARYEYTATRTLTAHKRMWDEESQPATDEIAETWLTDPGGSNSRSRNLALPSNQETDLFMPGEGLQVYPYESVRNPGYYSVDWYTGPNIYSYYQEQATRHSNGVYGIETDMFINYEFPEILAYTGGVATPGGLVAVPDTIIERQSSAEAYPFLFGSYNPITGEAVRSATPVCWT